MGLDHVDEVWEVPQDRCVGVLDCDEDFIVRKDLGHLHHVFDDVVGNSQDIALHARNALGVPFAPDFSWATRQ